MPVTMVPDAVRQCVVEHLIHQYGYSQLPRVAAHVLQLVFRELEHMWSVVIFRGVERVAR
ncbi:hypothetical protein AB0941_26765 [Streptomyces sp. NPDC013433]|uniref:hypothetical protein n=1 Tax=Streptomyces sp. NPDC013433 TaxID=3155604 RepID=UPI003454689C